MKKHINLILLSLIFTVGAFAQNEVEITGTVTDRNNETLVGVNVVIKDNHSCQ